MSSWKHGMRWSFNEKRILTDLRRQQNELSQRTFAWWVAKHYRIVGRTEQAVYRQVRILDAKNAKVGIPAAVGAA